MKNLSKFYKLLLNLTENDKKYVFDNNDKLYASKPSQYSIIQQQCAVSKIIETNKIYFDIFYCCILLIFVIINILLMCLDFVNCGSSN